MSVVFRKRAVEILETDGDGVDAFIVAAYWTDSGEDLNDDELADLTVERQDVVSSMATMRRFEKAEDMSDLKSER